MNLRETFEKWDDPQPDPVEGREDVLVASAFAWGFGAATGRWLVVSTNGPTMRIHDLTNDTRSASINRRQETVREVRIAVAAQLDALPYWEPELDTWGPDPWKEGEMGQ